MAVCPVCKGAPHSGKPATCPGSTWCDCQHRMPHKMNEESTTSNKLVEKDESTNV